ncbi:hypothetical protein HHK36_003522 [Tetracentron sinense]|uniref:C2 domain-containing protein n=1 Tax=Tetracentron sinense TaxID=13715 RepID=A0A835DNQ1_TETSI|nr:hypothetical protein HHK36_003522 [Tetracentron sinense]
MTDVYVVHGFALYEMKTIYCGIHCAASQSLNEDERGKTRTSSIKFQKSDPQWNEIFEFDKMDEPPSMLDLEVYDFEGPFDEATSLRHAEINFVKTSIADLADVWIPLQGKLAQACQSRLHLRIFLNDTRGNNVVKEYLIKMEKKVISTKSIFSDNRRMTWTITALCKARSLSIEQKMQIVEDESEAKSLQIEEDGSFLGLDDVSMSEIYSSGLPIPTNCFME